MKAFKVIPLKRIGTRSEPRGLEFDFKSSDSLEAVADGVRATILEKIEFAETELEWPVDVNAFALQHVTKEGRRVRDLFSLDPEEDELEGP